MKSLRTILKLAFAGMLAVIILTRPGVAKGQSGGYWLCNSGGMGSCMLSAQNWMSGCTGSCPHYGQQQNYCYEWPTCNNGICTSGYVCGSYPGSDCIQSCINQMDGLVNDCYNSWCTWVD